MIENLIPTVIEVVIVFLFFAIPVAFFVGRWSIKKKITRDVKFGKGQKWGHKDVLVTVKIAYKNKKMGNLHPVEGTVIIKKA